MHERTGGLSFEDAVVDWLLRLKADLQRNEKLDLRQGVDYSIRGFPSVAPDKPVDVQLTFQGGNLEKIEAFRKRKNGRDAWYVYAVAEEGMAARVAAMQQRNLVKRIARRPETFKEARFGIFLAASGPYRVFSIDKRIEKLRKRADPELSAGRRVQGRILALGANGSADVMTPDGATFHIRLGDAADRKLRVMLEEPDAFDDPVVGRLVTFVPHEKYALSVLLA